MSGARGLFRLWLVASAAWLIGWVLFIRGRCHPLPNGGMMCEHDRAGILSFMGDFVAWTPFQVYLLGFAVPIAVLVVGLVVVWFWPRRGLP
jgi:hypothetical protein